jgi:hypothetical protein
MPIPAPAAGSYAEFSLRAQACNLRRAITFIGIPALIAAVSA